MIFKVKKFCGVTIAEEKAVFNKKLNALFVKQHHFRLAILLSNISWMTRKRLMKEYIWSVALTGCETWATWKEDKKRLTSFEL